MLGVWLSRFGRRCLFDLETSNLVGSVFSNVSKEIFDRMTVISAKLSVHVTGADKAEKTSASSISEIGPRGL
ncbi:hypothetical protein ACFX1Q_025617 [Malus domestica]